MVDPARSGGTTHLHVVDDIEKVFSVLSSELLSQSEWRFFLRRLDLTNEDIAEIESKYTNDRREIIYRCLLRWQDRVGEGATVVKLVRALRQERLHRLADLMKTYTVRTPCTRCPVGGHDASCNQATPAALTRQKTKIKIKEKQPKFPSNVPKLPKISPSSSSSSLLSTRRSSNGSTSSRSSKKKTNKPRRQRAMSCDSATSVTSSNATNDDEPENEAENEDEVVNHPAVTEPEPEIPEKEESTEAVPAPVENGHSPTPSPEVTKEPEPVEEAPSEEKNKPMLQERKVAGHLRVEELIPEGGIPANFADLFKDMCAHLYKTIVKNAEDNIRALEEIIRLKNFFVHHLVVGSVVIDMRCHGDECYEALKEMYRSGALLYACQKVFGREDLLRNLELHYVKYTLYIEDFEGEIPPPEETFITHAQAEAEVKNAEPEEEQKERKSSKDETPEKLRREKTILVNVEVCAQLTAQIETDIPPSSLLQTLSEAGYRAANARKYYKTITSGVVMNNVIAAMNKSVSIPNMKFTRLDLKKDRVDIVMTCSSRKAINEAYSLFLKKTLLRICKEALLTKNIKKLAGNELIQLELEIEDEYITKCEKKFNEKLTKLKLNRSLEQGGMGSQGRDGVERDSASAQGRTMLEVDSALVQGRRSTETSRRERTISDSMMRREKSVVSPLNSSLSSRRSSQDSRRGSSGSSR